MEAQLIIALVTALITNEPEIVAAAKAIIADIKGSATGGPTPEQRMAALASYSQALAAARAATPGLSG